MFLRSFLRLRYTAEKNEGQSEESLHRNFYIIQELSKRYALIVMFTVEKRFSNMIPLRALVRRVCKY